MNTRRSIVKQAHELVTGDIIDISNMAAGFGYRYHRVCMSATPNGSDRFPGQVVFTLCVIGHTPSELRRREPFGWNLHVQSETRVRVLLREPPDNPRRPW